MTSLTPCVANALDQVAHCFQKNEDELAYLALTQKIEHAIRDKLAFVLHQQLREDPSLLVCREWNRRDLAIVQHSLPRLILEAKAIYSFDIVKTGALHPFPELVEEDLQKAAQWSEDASREHPLETLGLVVATHPHNKPGSVNRQAFKYYGGVTKYADESNDFSALDAVMHSRMSNLALVRSGKIDAGRAFDVKVSVFYWLYRQKNQTTH